MTTSRITLTVSLLSAFAGACGQDPPAVPDDRLDGTQPFVAVPRESTADVVAARSALTSGAGSGNAAAMGVQPGGDDNFYLAIRKDVLDQPWFLSAYMKQQAMRGPFINFPFMSLGTRVVSFAIQNDKLFVFDVSGQRTASAVNDPPNVLEAYPIVDRPEVTRLRGSDRYVVVDPSAGLNRFGITTDLYEDWPFRGLAIRGDTADQRIRVGVAFMQRFRLLADGVTYEEVFTGEYAGVDRAPYTVWGTLGLTLRRYTVGEGYSPTPDPGVPLYFLTGYRSIPGSGGYVYATPVKWNFHPGMTPVNIYIGAGAKRAQADFPAVDVLGAFKRGVEKWNDVLGFRALQAVFVDDDDVRDDDKSFMLVDYPGAGFNFAYADFRANPVNGEIRGSNVYFGGAFFGVFSEFADDPAVGSTPAAGPAAGAAPAVGTLLGLPSWAGLEARPLCAYPAGAVAGAPSVAAAASGALTADQKRALYIQGIVAHEMGHTLGLRHNLAGSLEPPSSSLMDYLDHELTVQVAEPGSYDREAIRYLYGLASDPPAHAFCTDEDVLVSPVCQFRDRGADPLVDDHTPYYRFLEGLVLDGAGPADPGLASALDTLLNKVLEFARDTGTVPPAERTYAVSLALDRAAVPMSASDLGSPTVVARANAQAETVLRRLALDDWTLRGWIVADVSDPAVVALVASQAGRMVRNEDGARTPALRRTAVDVLERMQTDVAFLELVASRDALQGALHDGSTPAAEGAVVADILARIDRALTPYFD